MLSGSPHYNAGAHSAASANFSVSFAMHFDPHNLFFRSLHSLKQIDPILGSLPDSVDLLFIEFCSVNLPFLGANPTSLGFKGWRQAAFKDSG
jgi:hypothetical protein